MVYKATEAQTCMCGHNPIIEICVLENIKNQKIAEVGNNCVNKILGIESGFFVRGIKKIKNDISSSVPKKLIEKSFDDDVVNEWEFVFYIDILRKINLSEKQWQKK